MNNTDSNEHADTPKKVNHLKQWLQVLFIPLFVMLAILSLLHGVRALGLLFLLPLGGTLGVYVGFTSSAPIYANGFKAGFALVLCVAILSMIIGILYRKQLWGKCLFSFGFYLWSMSGLVALGASY